MLDVISFSVQVMKSGALCPCLSNPEQISSDTVPVSDFEFPVIHPQRPEILRHTLQGHNMLRGYLKDLSEHFWILETMCKYTVT